MEDVTFDSKKLAQLLGSQPRLRMLGELSKGGPFTVGEMAAVGGVSNAGAWKHLQRMVQAGAVVPFKGNLYILASGVLAEGGGRVLRLGMATLDFGAEWGKDDFRRAAPLPSQRWIQSVGNQGIAQGAEGFRRLRRVIFYDAKANRCHAKAE